jgi:hypothetical protein
MFLTLCNNLKMNDKNFAIFDKILIIGIMNLSIFIISFYSLITRFLLFLLSPYPPRRTGSPQAGAWTRCEV